VRHITKEVLHFGAVGALNTLFGLGVIWLSMWLGAHPLLSNAIGYSLGLIISFKLNRWWTFPNDGDCNATSGIAPEAGKFLIAFLAAWSLNIAVVAIGLNITGFSAYLMQVAGMGAYTMCFFILCKFWVFAR
jgi:putative flippase GtrA